MSLSQDIWRININVREHLVAHYTPYDGDEAFLAPPTSRTLGASPMFIIFKEILSNTIGQIITQLMFSIPTAIFTEAFLSFVGLGIPVPMCSLGSLISDAFNSFTTHPYQILPPIIVLATLMLCFNMLADGLREAFDPKLKEM